MNKHTVVTFLAGLGLATSAVAANAATRVFNNPAPITIYDDAPASLYPSPITVSGITGGISDVQVTLRGFSHTYAGDLNLLLVAPGGQKIMLAGRAGGSSELNNATITFSAAATTNFETAASPIPSGTYHPIISSLTNSYSPAPAGPYSTDLTTLNGPGIAQNGTWNLYVSDHAGADVGAISGGWTLSVNGFYTCAAEGYTGAKLTLCHQVCEINYPPTTLNGLIKLWTAIYRTAPTCAR